MLSERTWDEKTMFVRGIRIWEDVVRNFARMPRILCQACG